MGDRAYAQIICSADHVAVFEELGFVEEEYWTELPKGVSFLVDQEANYGHASALRDLAAKGYVFIAQHDAGGEFDAARLVSDGETFRKIRLPNPAFLSVFNITVSGPAAIQVRKRATRTGSSPALAHPPRSSGG